MGQCLRGWGTKRLGTPLVLQLVLEVVLICLKLFLGGETEMGRSLVTCRQRGKIPSVI